MQISLLCFWLLVKPILIEIVCQSWKCVKGYLWEEEGEQSVPAPCLLNHSKILSAGQRDYAANCPATSQVEHWGPNLCKWHSGYLRSFAKLFFLKERPGKYCASEFTSFTCRCSSDIPSFLYSYFTIVCLFPEQHSEVSLGACVVVLLRCPEQTIAVLVWYCLFLSLQKWLHFVWSWSLNVL